MTNTPMSEREKELLGTAKAVRNTLRLLYGERPTNLGNLMKDLNRVIAAYDPKPEKEYTMPEWKDFVFKNAHTITPIRMKERGIDEEVIGIVTKESLNATDMRSIYRSDYNAIREATAKNKGKEG